MKKFQSLLATLCFVAIAMFFVSCNKDLGSSTDQSIAKTYASAISGQFIPQHGDVTLKSAPTVGGHEYGVYKKTGTVLSKVDGTEFLPGSAPALDWASGANPVWISGAVYITYCPVLPLRVVLKSTEGGASSPYSYLGIWEGTPSAASFPISVKCRRLGDVLTLNTDALTALPGYSNMSFDVIYDKSVIDVNGTAMSAINTSTEIGWPTYVYSSVVPNFTVTKTKAESMANKTIYDGLDYKITGTITIKIHVDATTLTVTTPATVLGKGLAITLSTNKVGWYNSGTIGVSAEDITVDTVTLPVN